MTTRFTQSFIHNIATMATYIPTSSKRLASLLAICLLGMATTVLAQTVTIYPNETAGTVEVSGGPLYTYRATPKAGYYFLHFERSGMADMPTNPATIPAGAEVTAVFAPLPELVDLGLGDIRWASCNVGATTPEEEGQRFAWGETTPYTGGDYTFTATSLGLENDAAAQRLGNGWHMPTYGNISNLLTTCDWEKVDGGYKVINRDDRSKYIFLSSSGGTDYWSNTIGTLSTDLVFAMNLNGGNKGTLRQIARSSAALVRPVQLPYTITVTTGYHEVEVTMKDAKTGEAITLNSYTDNDGINGYTGKVYYGTEVIVSVVETGNLGFIRWTDNSSNEISRRFKVTADVTLEALLASAGEMAYLPPVDLWLPSGTRWAVANIGSLTATGTGQYFAAGEKSSKGSYTWSNYALGYNESASDYGFTAFTTAGSQIEGTEYDAVEAVWSDTWRMPTKADLQELWNEASSEWTSKEVSGGVVWGYNFTSKVANEDGTYNSIFLPVTGYKDGTGTSRPADGYYMSSTISDDITKVDVMHFAEGIVPDMSALARYLGQVIRPVHVKKMVDITVEANDATRGNVTGSIRCVERTNVEITAEANAGYTFVKWNDDVVESVRTVNVNQHTTYTAIFEPVECKIEATLADPHGSSTIAITADNETISSGNMVQHGKEVTVAVEKDDAYEIVRWIVDGEELKDAEGKTYTDLAYEFIAHDNTTITVEMKESIVTLPTFLKEGEEGGTVKIANEQGVSKEDNKCTHGEKVFLTPQANEGYTFKGWSDGNTDNPREITAGVTSTKFTANFERKSHDLSTLKDIDPYLGTVTTVCGENNGPIFYHGDVVTITFNVNPANEERVDFITWTDQDPRTATISRTVTMNDDFKPFKLVATRLVDLGTSVLWSQINVGATTPLEAGDYFAWGNTSPIEVSKTYKTGVAELPLENDAANFNWGGKWQSPTADEWNELMDGTKCRWIKKQTEAGVSYWRVENKDNSNEYIELSLCGIKRPTENNPSFVDTWGDYSTANTSDNAKVQYVRLQKTSYGVFAGGGPDVGRVVRPIHPRDEVYTITATSNDENKGTVTGGGEYPKNKMITLIATPKSTYRFKQWNDGSTDNPREINVTTDENYTAEFETIVPIEPSYVDLGLPSGVLWATFNLGAESAISSGNYFAWGEVHPYMKNTYQDPGNMDDMDVLAPEYDAARVNWSKYGDWRIPTKTEMDELKQNCEWEYVTEDGVPCYRFTSNKNNNSILLPAYGYNKNDIIDGASSDYLSSSADAGKKIRYLRMTITSNPDAGVVSVTQGGSRDIGRLIRPVITGVIITVNADGEGTVTGGGSYVAGAKVTITATPADGYYFKHWQGTNNTDASFDITVETAQTYTAVFAPIDDTVDETIVNATVNEDATAAIIPAKDGYTVVKVIDAEGNTLANAANVAASAFTGCEIVTAYYTSATQNYVQYVRMPLIYTGSNSYISDCDCDVHIPSGKKLALSNAGNENNSLTLHGTGKLEIAPTGSLTLETSILGATDTTSVHIKASATSTGTLIMKGYDNDADPIHATVEFYASQYNGSATGLWNPIGVPFTTVDGVKYFKGSWVTVLNNTTKDWDFMTRGSLAPFTGYLVTQNKGAKNYILHGELVRNVNQQLVLIYTDSSDKADNGSERGDTYFANSWTAPIDITALADAFKGGAEAGVHLIAPAGNYVPHGFSEDAARDGVINPMEGFFVKTTQPSGAYVQLDYSKHVVAPAAKVSAPAKKAAAEREDKQTLNILVNADQPQYDRLFLIQKDGYSKAFDNGADVSKMLSDGFPNLSVQTIDRELGIYATNNWDSTLVNFRKADLDTYTLSFEYTGTDNLILKDFYTGSTCDINATSTYTFEATGNDMGRFAIFKKPEAGETVTNLLNVWVSNDMLVFSNPAGERATVAIYSADGKLVQTITTAETMTEINVPAQGVYFIQLTTATTTQTIKQIF